MKTNVSYIIRQLVVLIALVVNTASAMAETYISDVYILCGWKWNPFADDVPDGYEMLDRDLNEGKFGDYVYICYKTTNKLEDAITGLVLVTEDKDKSEYSGKNNKTFTDYNGCTYKAAPYSDDSDGGNLRQGRDEKPLWLYYTKETANKQRFCVPSAITELNILYESDIKNLSSANSYVYTIYQDYWSTSKILPIQATEEDVTTSSVTHGIFLEAKSSEWSYHKHQIVEYKEPTCTTVGTKVHYKCSVCSRIFEDYGCNKELNEAETVIPELGHDWDKDLMTYDENTGAWNLDCKRCQHHEARKMMCITANEDNVNVRLNSLIDPYYDDLDYYEDYYEEPEVFYMKNGDSDGGPLTSDMYIGVEMNKGDMLWLFGRDTNGTNEFYRNEENRTWFEIRGSVSCTGNVTSICDETGGYGYLHTSLCGVFNSTGLDKSPRLNATNLYYDCYDGIFRDCPNLKDVTICDANKEQIESAITNNWLRGTASNGIVHITDELALANANLQLPANWRTDKVVVSAKEDPTEGQAGNYYATYYDSQSEYSVKEGTTAYAGTVEGDALKMTAEADNIIPAGEGVLLKGNTADVILTLSDTNKETTPGNMLRGSDTDTSAPANCYIFTYAQNGLGFYQYAAGKSLGAHKAYLQTVINNARGFRMVFDDGTTTGIDPLLYPSKGDDAIYNLQGVRMNKLQKGINIVNGQKVVIK